MSDKFSGYAHPESIVDTEWLANNLDAEGIRIVNALTGDIHPTLVKDIAIGAKVADAMDQIDWVMPMGSSQDVPALAADVHRDQAFGRKAGLPVWREAIIQLTLSMPEVEVVIAGDTIRWQGDPTNASFVVAPPADLTTTELIGTVRLSIDGVPLGELERRNVSWGIATNKPRAYTAPLLERLNLQPQPGSVVCPDQ